MKLFVFPLFFNQNPKLIGVLCVTNFNEISSNFDRHKNLLVSLVAELYAKPTEQRPFALEKL